MMQPIHASRRILLPVRGWFMAASLAMAVFLDLIPLGRFPGLPDWAALVLVFWCIHQPLRVGMGGAFLIGLIVDVGDASVMGQHALAYVLLAFASGALSRRILWFPLIQQALHVLPLLLATQLVMVGVRLIGGGEFPSLLWFLGSFTGIALWSPLTYLLLLPQFRPVERDETRPI